MSGTVDNYLAKMKKQRLLVIRNETEEIQNNNFRYKVLEEARVGGIQ